MFRLSRAVLAAAAALALAACTQSGSWSQPAGATLDDGRFGAATKSNAALQSGRAGIRVSLNRRFAAEVDPTVTFPFNSAMLDARAQAVLARQASWIRQFPEVRFRVYGHTDLVGPAAYNRRLGLRRAQAVVAFLTARGIDRGRLQAVVSFGETQPLIATRDRNRRNRRTVTEVSGFVSTHPTVLNGKYAEVIFREYVESASERPSGGPTQAAAVPPAQ